MREKYTYDTRKEAEVSMNSTISIGMQDFGKLIRSGVFYVDKTSFIKEWWENQDDVTLVTRPRRFGKTLTLSMVDYFFSNQHVDSGKLFEKLDIWKEEKYQDLQGTFPVIFVSFAGIKAENYATARDGIIQVLLDLYAKYYFLLQSDVLNEQEREYFAYVRPDMSDAVAAMALHRLAICMYRYYGKKAIILLDEYDTPLQEAYVYGYWEELTTFIRSLFNCTFKTNPYLERGLMTGITRVSKESIFSDLNNLEVVTTTSEKYASSFGFTEQEVFQTLEQMGKADKKDEVKQWYDGFTFGRHTDIYNPWSIIKFLDTGEFNTYWAATSENSLVSKLIREGSPQLKMDFEDLLKGKTVMFKMDEQIVFEQLQRKKGAIWSLLLASGYLKVEKKIPDRRGGYYLYGLKITNYEVLLMFEDMVESWFPEESSSYENFKQALLLGDLDYMNQYMNQVALQTFSSFDVGRKPSEHLEPERFYHGFVLGLIVDLADKYKITSNKESGLGRYDVMMEPLVENLDGIIMEFKVHNPAKEKNLEQTAENALRQIREKKYDTELEMAGISSDRIRHYGFAFEGKKVLIGSDS